MGRRKVGDGATHGNGRFLWRQEFFGTIRINFGMVFKDWDRRNVGTCSDDGSPIIMGVDFNRSPYCCALMQVQETSFVACKRLF